MKLKSLATTILAAGMLAAAGPSFGVACSAVTTVGGWMALGAAGCTDIDNDSTWIFGATNLPGSTSFTITELDGPGFDVYNVAFGFDPVLTAASGQFISYTATGTAAEMFNAADYDSNVTEASAGGARTTALIVGASGPVALLLTSVDGSHDPAFGETPFTPNLTIGVTDTILAIPAGATMNGINNSFLTGMIPRVPEPASLALLGLALAGMGLVRRTRKLS